MCAIRYDEFVKRPNEEFEYTQEQIEELIRCRDDVLYFITNYVKIVTLDKGEVLFEPYDYQIEALDLIENNRFFIGLWSRQSGKSTIVSAYALWYAIFHEDKNIGIVSNKESSAKRLLDNMKKMYESLPIWLKPGVKEYAKTSIKFDNGTNMIISATTADSFRGWPMNLIVSDELGFVDGGKAHDFWASNYPTISSSKKSKILVISTPNGLYNLFHELWVGANKTNEKWNGFKPQKVAWDRVPGRDKKWADDQIKILGQKVFNQEFAVVFLGSVNTVIVANVLRSLMNMDIDPEFFDLKDRLRLWEKPVEGAMYALGVDPSKGTGEHDACIQILKINSVLPVDMEQVGVFQDNTTNVYEFSQIIHRLSIYYNNAYILCENNGEGSGVISQLWWNFENENLVNTGQKAANLGIRSGRNTKTKAVLLMKKFIEDGSILLRDKETIEQLGSFIEENDKFFGKDKPDDLVDALFWGCYLFEMNILSEDWNFKDDRTEEEKNDAWGVLSDINNTDEDWSWLTSSDVFNS